MWNFEELRGVIDFSQLQHILVCLIRSVCSGRAHIKVQFCIQSVALSPVNKRRHHESHQHTAKVRALIHTPLTLQFIPT